MSTYIRDLDYLPDTAMVEACVAINENILMACPACREQTFLF